MASEAEREKGRLTYDEHAQGDEIDALRLVVGRAVEVIGLRQPAHVEVRKKRVASKHI